MNYGEGGGFTKMQNFKFTFSKSEASVDHVYEIWVFGQVNLYTDAKHSLNYFSH